MNAPSSISLFATFELATARRAILAYTVIILVLSSPILMPTNPQLIAASAGPITPSRMADTSSYHSTLSVSPSASNTALSPSAKIGTPTKVPSLSTSNQAVGDFIAPLTHLFNPF